jgi:hypothetical protein
MGAGGRGYIRESAAIRGVMWVEEEGRCGWWMVGWARWAEKKMWMVDGGGSNRRLE